jgi:hypothetical protein
VKKDAIYEGEREVRTFADLNHGADVLLDTARDREKGSYYTIMGSLLLSAFTFEAYVNHLGDKTFPFWVQIEATRVLDKYAVLYKQLNISPDFGVRPYQTLQQLFRFRNAIAHGKSVLLREAKEVDASSDLHEHMPKAEWEDYATLANAERAREDISAIVTELHKAAGLGNYPFVHAPAVGSMKYKSGP